jgi:hypothetical protein
MDLRREEYSGLIVQVEQPSHLTPKQWKRQSQEDTNQRLLLALKMGKGGHEPKDVMSSRG